MSDTNKEVEAVKRLGEWQRCPICEGTGEILADGFTSSIYQQCPTCSGNRIIQKPELISDQLQSTITKQQEEIERLTIASNHWEVAYKKHFSE